MINPNQIYDILINYANSTTLIKEINIGLTWTICVGEGIGLSMSPTIPTRTLSWSGTLVNKNIAELAPWLKSWQPYEATVAMAAINSVINHQSPLVEKAQILASKKDQNLAVFEYFLPMIRGQKVSIIGRYPGLSRYEQEFDLQVIERQPIAEDFPENGLPQYSFFDSIAKALIDRIEDYEKTRGKFLSMEIIDQGILNDNERKNTSYCSIRLLCHIEE